MKKGERVIYYRNSLTDDFAGTNIKQKKIDNKYIYYPKNIFFKFFSFLLYYVFAKFLVFLMVKIIYHQKFVNKKLLRKEKNRPIMIYGNHTQTMLDAYVPNLLRLKKNYIIVNPDAVSIRGVRGIVKALGGIPLPNTKESVKNYKDALENIIKSNNSITIFPEAHIWPYYTKIRDFKEQSFRYPVDYNIPVYSLVTVYVRSKCFYRKRPRALSVISGPFYKDDNLSRIDAIKDLRDRVYESMVNVSNSYNQVEYIKYVEIKENE
ncbi:1-acyl-sn-glycerol-3-phosphate acyltransferase [bacterium]|nr:1-acyl-sn-glycerol-3-phosphate acyltransferase [bacterium]